MRGVFFMSSKNIKKHGEDSKSVPINKIIIGSFFGFLAFFVFIAIYTLFSLKTGGEMSLYKPAGWVFGFLSGFIGGFVSVRPVKQKGAIYGAVSGVAISLLVATVLFFINNSSAGSGVFVLMGLILAGGIAGGITAVNLKFKKKY